VQIFDCLDDVARPKGIAAAVSAVLAQELIILPTDTAYAVAGDAFASGPAHQIRSIKGMDDAAPLQVLISGTQVLDGVASPASQEARKLADAFWPGPLTLIVPSSPSVRWDIGGAPDLVQVRVPAHPIAAELLSQTGPLVASAARGLHTGVIDGAEGAGEDTAELSAAVSVFLNYSTIQPVALSTIVDCSSAEIAILRKGRISVGQLVDVLGYMPVVLDPNR
jgi:tRNA threonylcarbamoyl adenosine modification protein (Sua5/YciO/YrdC/YwlC family)